MAPFKTKEDHDIESLIQETRENTDAIIEKRKNILESFQIENPNPLLLEAVDIAREEVQSLLDEIGMSSVTIPDLILIDWKNQEKVSEEFKELGGGNYKDQENVVNVYNGLAVVFIQDSRSLIDQARIIYSATLQSIGKKVIAVNEKEARGVRVGLHSFTNTADAINPWLLEFGITGYESTNFISRLGKKESFISHANEKDNHLRKLNYDDDNQVYFESGLHVPIHYTHMVENSDGEKLIGISIENAAGSVFDLLLSRIPVEEQSDFMELAHKARIELKLIPKLAKKIDAVWGKGTYSELLRCSVDWESIQKVADKLEEKKHFNTLLEEYQKQFDQVDGTESRQELLKKIEHELQEIDGHRTATLKTNYYNYTHQKPGAKMYSLPSKFENNYIESLSQMAKRLSIDIPEDESKHQSISVSKSIRRVGSGSLKELKVGDKNQITVDVTVIDPVWPYNTEQTLYVILEHSSEHSIRVISTASSVETGGTDELRTMKLSMLRKWDAFTFEVTPKKPNEKIMVGYTLVNSYGMPIMYDRVEMKSEE